MTSPPTALQPTTHRFTRDEFYHMVEQGWFSDKRVELIDGEVIDMPAQSNLHALAIKLTEDALEAAFGANVWVRVQMPIDLSPLSVPDPDVAVVAGSPRSHTTPSNPTTALLVVEVSDTTLSGDRNRKASLYATSGIADYWIINLSGRHLEVRRNPQPDSAAEFGASYATLLTLQVGDSVSPLAAPGANIAVADLLP